MNEGMRRTEAAARMAVPLLAESALRAVLNPRCQPFKLPPDRYEAWQVMELNFDPSIVK